MTRLIPLDHWIRDHTSELGADVFDPTNRPAYAMNHERVGMVKGALVDDHGKIRYLRVDVGGWFSTKQVMVPVGLARLEEDGVYLDSLTRDQVRDLSTFTEGQDYTAETQTSDERVLRATGAAVVVPTTGGLSSGGGGDAFRTPQKMQLLEERLKVSKTRVAAGSVEVSKRVETRQEQVNISLEREELTIERRVVSDARPVEGEVLFASTSKTIRVDLEAEAAKVSKAAYVTEEIALGKRTVTEHQSFSETVGREVLDVTNTGAVTVHTSGLNAADGRTVRQKTSDTVNDAGDPLDGQSKEVSL